MKSKDYGVFAELLGFDEGLGVLAFDLGLTKKQVKDGFSACLANRFRQDKGRNGTRSEAREHFVQSLLTTLYTDNHAVAVFDLPDAPHLLRYDWFRRWDGSEYKSFAQCSELPREGSGGRPTVLLDLSTGIPTVCSPTR